IWLLANSPQGKKPARSIFIAGASAGGNLALTTSLCLKAGKIPLPSAILPVSPVTALTGNSESITVMDGVDPVINKKAFLFGLPLIYLYGPDVLKTGQSKINKLALMTKALLTRSRNLRNPFVSPIFGNLSGLPPIFINVGDIELLRDDSIRFVDKARAAGVNATVKVWPHMMHVFVAFSEYLPEADQCLT